MAARKRCRWHWHSSNMALSSGRLMTSIISPRAGRGAPDCWRTKVSSFPCTGTYYTRHQGPRAQRHIWTVPVVTATLSGRYFRRLTYKFYGAWWPRVASWRCFGGFVDPWFVACLFNDWTRLSRKNLCLFWVDRRTSLLSVSYLATLLWRKDDEDYFPQNYVYVLRTATTRHVVSFIDFYFHFLANFQA